MIVLSDCAGAYWWDGTLLPMLQDWGQVMPTVVWQMLPPWMWKRTALGRGTAGAIRNDSPGVANQRLKLQVQERDEPEDALQRVAMPVVTSDVQDLTRWSLMVAGDRRAVTPGFLLPQRGGSIPRAKSYEQLAEERARQNFDDGGEADFNVVYAQALEALARDRTQRFLALASPAAQRLIMLLAAAPVITLPVVRLIRDAMFEQAQSPLPVAEVLLSGLLQRLPEQDVSALTQSLHGEDSTPSDPPASGESPFDRLPLEGQDLVQYDFAPRVRSVLLELLPAEDTIEVINSVSAAVERRWNQLSNQDFRAFLTNPNAEVAEELQGLRSFASITADILEQLGGDYIDFAQALRQGTGEIPPDEPDELEAIDPDAFPLEDEEYEVVEFISFPALTDFDFIDAQLDDTPAFPPPLQTVTFPLITFETAADRLAPFEFTVATLQRQTTQTQGQQQSSDWIIQRQTQSASRLVESLPGDIDLEMVLIPSGTFQMGSPEDEPERNAERESPQHLVTVAAFCMGRYPITQAQWRVVAAMPQVERKLDPDPSNFKGNLRPVERVSWHDAIEFCARLSAHTERQYRLPSEAEWEYACRAGTTTPFHFGDIITPEVANYNGNYAYGKGPKGEYRQATTPVDHFGIANGYGLSDMHGNVREWCQDPWHSNYEGAPTDGSAWLGNSSSRVRRGGSWLNDPRDCRSAYRNDFLAEDRLNNIGFRVCCSAPRAL